MARQSGILGLRGTVGGLVFKANGTVSQAPAKRAITAPRSLENGVEFGAAARAGKLFRDAFRAAANTVKTTLAGEVTKAMRAILGLDTSGLRGERQVLKANIGALLGLSFTDASLSSTLYAAYSVVRVGAVVTLNLPTFNPSTDLSIPQGATHCQLVTSTRAFNFQTGITTKATHVDQAPLPISGTSVSNLEIDMTFAAVPGASDAVVTIVGVNFFQEVNGDLYPLENGANNALSVVYAV